MDYERNASRAKLALGATTMTEIVSPFAQFFDVSGAPLNNGAIYIGTGSLDAQSNPIPVYWDNALTIPALQPIRTLNGYIVRNGTPARIFCNADNFSMTVKTNTGRTVWSIQDATSDKSLLEILSQPDGASLIGFTQSNTGTPARTVQDKLRDIVSLTDFGAGSAGLQAAVDYLTSVGGGTLKVPSGTHTITAETVLTSNITVKCDVGATFDVSGTASGTRVFYAAGTFGTAYNLSANAAVGATSLSVAAGVEANFAANDWVQIYSSTIYDTGYSNAPIGEIVQISGTSSGTINLKTPLYGGPYNIANAAQIRKCTFVQNICVDGGIFIGSSNAAVSHIGVRYDLAYNCQIKNIRAQYLNGNGINIRSGLFCTVSNVFMEDALGINGYGVNFTDTSQDCTVVDSVFVRCRHAVTNTRADKGITRRITYQNLRSYDSINTGDAFDTHSNGEDIQFVNCISFDASGNGFNIECGSASLIGCMAIRNALNGIAFSVGTTIKQSNFQAVGCEINTSNTYGIRIDEGSAFNSSLTESITIVGCSSIGAQIGCYVSGNSSVTVSNVVVQDGYFTGTATTGAGYFGDYVTKFRVSNNHFSTNQIGGSALQLSGVNVSYGAISSNVLEYTVNGANGTSSSACIRLTNVSNISLANNVGVQPSSAGGFGIRTTGTTSNIFIGDGNNFAACTNPNIYSSQTLTIAAGVITLPHGANMFVVIDTEGGAATDDLDTINGGVPGQVITLQQVSSARDPVIKDGTGNLRLAGDFTMSALQDSITLKYNGTVWVEISRADIA